MAPLGAARYLNLPTMKSSFPALTKFHSDLTTGVVTFRNATSKVFHSNLKHLTNPLFFRPRCFKESPFQQANINYHVILRILGFFSSSFNRRIHHPWPFSSPILNGSQHVSNPHNWSKLHLCQRGSDLIIDINSTRALPWWCCTNGRGSKMVGWFMGGDVLVGGRADFGVDVVVAVPLHL